MVFAQTNVFAIKICRATEAKAGRMSPTGKSIDDRSLYRDFPGMTGRRALSSQASRLASQGDGEENLSVRADNTERNRQ